MLRLRDALAGVLAAAAFGCSPVKDNSNVPDAAIDATDTRAPMIASSVPADTSNKVSVLAPVVVFFDERLDGSTVDNTTVRLGYELPWMTPFYIESDLNKLSGPVYAGLTPVRGTVTYDEDASKIVFVPSLPLPYGASVTLSIDGVKDMGGNSFSGQVRFQTFVNAQLRQSFFTPTGVLGSWTGFPVDMAGRMAKRIGGGAPGADQIWFTADDPINQHLGLEFTADGRVEKERLYSPGPDNRYDTADDTFSIVFKYTYDADRNLTERVYSTQPGPDAVLDTPDDIPNNLYAYHYMGGVPTGMIHYSSAGTDGMWRTSDDRCSIYWDFELDSERRKTREIYKGCGTDGLPRTADDAFGHYREYSWDAMGQLQQYNFRNAAGPDGMWLTNDDGYSLIEKYRRDAKGLATTHVRHNGPGPDAMWNTADDAILNITATVYSAVGLAEEVTYYNGAGPDAMWETADDLIGYYTKYAYDENGNRTDGKQYAPGPDAKFKTADDYVSIDYDYDLAH